MVLVIFVIMLLNLGDEKGLREGKTFRASAGIALAVGLMLELAVILFMHPSNSVTAGSAAAAEGIGTVEGIGTALFSRFVLPFEVTSILLLVAIAGAVVLAKKRL